MTSKEQAALIAIKEQEIEEAQDRLDWLEDALESLWQEEITD